MTRGSSEQVFIVVRAPNGDVREFPIGNVAIVIGRDESADIRVEDRKVSRRHAAFKLIDGQPWVDDLGSINGIKLNGKKVSERAMMLAGDVVMVGGYEVMLKDAPRRRSRDSGSPMDRAPTGDVASERTFDPVAPPRTDTAQARLILVGQTKPVLAKRFTLGFGESIVGRLEECAVPILDGSVSRQHAKIVVTTQRATVSDLASSNGTFVNEIRVDNADLTSGDRLKFGSILFDVELAPEIPSRIGPIEPSYHAAAIKPPAPAPAKGKLLIAVGGGVLLVAVAVFFGMWRYSDRVRALLGKKPVAVVDAAVVAENVAPAPDGGFAIAQVETPTQTAETPVAAPPDAGVTPQIVALRTSTSPYGKKGPDGLPLDLPVVDQSFDFDTFVRGKLEEAVAFETNGQFAEVRRVIGELLAQDPINQDAQQIKRRIDLAEQGQQALAQGDQLRAQSKLLRALDVYATVPEGSPAHADATARIAALKPIAIKRELNRAEAELRKKKTWDEAHRRLRRVLELEPEHPLAKPMIASLETKMREAGMKFQARGDPAPKPGERDPGSATRREEIAKRWEDRGLVRVVQTYADGDIGDAIKRAEVALKRAKGPKKQLAKNLSTSLKKLQNKYERVKNEVANDPAQAWAHLMEFQKIELEVLPENMKSYLVTELEETIAEAFAERGSDFYNQERFELAFQNWDSGFKLDPSNAKIVAGLKNLENKAESWAKEAELAAQRGQPDACDQWQRITRMTRMTSDLYKKARERLSKGGCS